MTKLIGLIIIAAFILEIGAIVFSYIRKINKRNKDEEKRDDK